MPAMIAHLGRLSIPLRNLHGEMAGLTMFVSVDGDSIGARIGRARLHDDVDEVRRVDAAIWAGNDAVTSWAINSGGHVIESGGDEVAVEVPAAALEGLEAVRRSYAGIVGATLSVGVGAKLSESSKALMASKLRGKDRTSVFGPEVEAEVARAEKDPQEAEKIAQEYLQKAGFEKPAAPTVDHAATAGADDLQAPTESSDLEAGFHQAAHRQGQADRAKSAKSSMQLDQAQQEVAGALQSLRQQLPALAQVKKAFPQTYDAVLQLTTATLGLARTIRDVDGDLSKAERLPRIYRAGDLRVPSVDHSDRANFDAGHRRAAEARWSNGVPLQPSVVDLDPLDVGDHRTLDPRRVAVYREMLANGDSPPPVVVDHDGRILQGRHHAAAARSEGRTAVSALVRQLPAEDKVEPDPSVGVPGGAALDKGELPAFLRVCPECGSRCTHVDGKLKDHAPKGSGLDKGRVCPGSGRNVDVKKADAGAGAAPPPTQQPQNGAQKGPRRPGSAVPRLTPAHRGLPLPVGTQTNGEVLVQHQSGKKSWRGVREGMILGTDPEPGLYGQESHPVSAIRPNST